MVRAGVISKEQARLSANSNIITRALGVDHDVEVETDVRPYEKNDRFILCTDGVWGAYKESQILKYFINNPKSLQGTMDVLNLQVEKAGREKGGNHDNFSAIILETNINSILKTPMSKKIKNLLYALIILCCLSVSANIVLGIKLNHYRSHLKETEEPIGVRDERKDVNSEVTTNVETIVEESTLTASTLQEESKTQTNTTTKSLHEEIMAQDGANAKSPELTEAEQSITPDANDNEINNKIDDILLELNEIAEMNAGDYKNKKLKDLRDKIDTLKPFLDKSKERNIKQIKDWLTAEPAKQSPQPDHLGKKKKHYDTIRENIENLKQP